MNKKPGDRVFGIGNPRQWTFSRRGMLAIAGALVVILALLIGLNVGGLREQLLWRISPPRITAIAVLPFENLSHDPTQQYFADGMTQMFIRDMQQIGTFRTTAPSSVMRYKEAPKALPEIARELNVDAVVEGAVLRSGNRVQLSANLTHAPTNRRLWGQTYERDARDVLNMQAEILRSIARAIHVELTPREQACFGAPRPVNPQAHEALMRGMWGGEPAKTRAYLNQAIQLDPAYANAYDYMANWHWMRNMFPALAPRDTYPPAKEAAQKALGLLPTVSLSHRILASTALEYDWQFAEAEKEWQRALELVPSGPMAHHMYSHFLLSMGRMEEAKAETRRAMQLNPIDPSLVACASWHDIAIGDYEAAEKRSLEALSRGAPDQLARLALGWSYALRGRHDEAIAEFQKAVVGWKSAVFPTAVLSHAYAVAGKESAARDVLDKLLARSKKEYVSPYEIAMIYAGLGDRDRAFEWLEKAYADRASLLVYFRMDPRIWSLQSDPRFQDLLRRMNFPQATQ